MRKALYIEEIWKVFLDIIFNLILFLVLSPYKYAGYSQLIKTIDLESADDSLFKEGGGQLLIAAVELCYWTLRSSPLNAEQLRRDGGLEVSEISYLFI